MGKIVYEFPAKQLPWKNRNACRRVVPGSLHDRAINIMLGKVAAAFKIVYSRGVAARCAEPQSRKAPGIEARPRKRTLPGILDRPRPGWTKDDDARAWASISAGSGA